MKKIFPIIGHVFLGVILLVFFCVVSSMFIDSQQEHYLWISLALSITLSIIIPILRYKRVIKNKERLSLEVNDIESLKKESNQLSQDDPNRNAKEEELKKLKNKFRKDRKNKDGKKGCFAIIAIAIFFVLSIFGVLNWLFSGDDPVENEAPKIIQQKKTINQIGRDNLQKQYWDPRYVESGFWNDKKFVIRIKSPPEGKAAEIYARVVCQQAKDNYNTSGFVIFIMGLKDQKVYGQSGCY